MSQRWRETYSKLAKSVVRLGQPEGDAPGRSVGLGWRSFPRRSHDAARGSQIRRASCAPAARWPGSALRGGGGKPNSVMQDADGTAARRRTARAPDDPRDLIEESSAPDADWKSLFTTLTFSASPRP